MALEKVTAIDLIQVLEDGQMQVRWATKIMEDGIEISRKFTDRQVYVPGQDITGKEDKVKVIANVVWTQEVKDKYKAEKDKLKLSNA